MGVRENLLKRSIMMFDFACVNLAILVLIGLVASEADPQLVYQQPSYIYPGGHPVYKTAGIPYAYPVYNPVAAPRAGSSIASGPEMGEIVKDVKPAPAFYEVASAREEEEPNLFTSAELREEFAQDLAQNLEEIDEILASKDSEDNGSCDDELKGDGQCDEVNDKFKCDWDYGDCCKKNWIGNGRCNPRNNFIGCGNNAATDFSIDTYKNDGGDCFPRECLMNEDDPLNVAYTTKYGEFWYNNLNTSSDIQWTYLDPQHFFPEITKQNECRALNCLFSDFREGSTWWEFIYLSCDTKDSDGSDYDSLGPGCYCQVRQGPTLVTNQECCFYNNCEVDQCEFNIAFDENRTWGRTVPRSSGRKRRVRGKGKKRG